MKRTITGGKKGTGKMADAVNFARAPAERRTIFSNLWPRIKERS